MKFALGKHLKDRITQYSGVNIAFVQHITGCNQYLLMPTVGKDGKKPDGEWIDESRLVLSDSKLDVQITPDVKIPGADGNLPKEA
jgi:hypothetical protein